MTIDDEAVIINARMQSRREKAARRRVSREQCEERERREGCPIRALLGDLRAFVGAKKATSDR